MQKYNDVILENPKNMKISKFYNNSSVVMLKLAQSCYTQLLQTFHNNNTRKYAF